MENPGEDLRDSSEKGTRTPDRADMSRLLYQLSYLAIRLLLSNRERIAELRKKINRVLVVFPQIASYPHLHLLLQAEARQFRKDCIDNLTFPMPMMII